MYRSGGFAAAIAFFICAGIAAGDLSPSAEFIRSRPYQEISTDNTIGGITTVQKASGIVPRIADGLVVWADGRSGEVAIIGRDLTDASGSEFLISVPENQWQEGNPFAGWYTAGSTRYVVYDTANTGLGDADPGNIEGSNLSTISTLANPSQRQRSPVITNASGGDYVCWIDDPGTASSFPGYTNTDIYAAPFPGSFSSPLAGATNITNNPAPRDSLSADGNYLVWQEMRSVGIGPAATTSWDVAVYDFGTSSLSYIDGPTVGKNQIAPDVSGDLVVWTQEEDPSGTGATNIYFMDLATSGGPFALTTTGSATNAAITRTTVEEEGKSVETYFVVWQDHRDDDSLYYYAGGNGETDYAWDIWCQEIRFDGSEWALYKDAFVILDAQASGRQTCPDIDGLDVTWQSQAPNVEDIYVWGAVIPEPFTSLILLPGAAMLLARRRRLERTAK